MPRQARVIVNDGFYYILALGNNGQPLFRQEADYHRYLKLLSYYLASSGVSLYHYVLMPTHVHLVLSVTVGVMLSRAMRGLHVSYTWHYRKRYRYSGHLWQGRFKSLRLLDANRSLHCGRSLEQHPVRSGLTATPEAYPWSSYRVYADGAQQPFLIQNPHYEMLGNSAPERQARYQQLHHSLVPPAASDTPPIYPMTQAVSAHPLMPLDRVWMFPTVRRPRGRPRKQLLATSHRIDTPDFND